MGYTVLEVIESDDDGWEPEPYTHEQRVARSVEGWDPSLSGARDVFESKAPSKAWVA